MHDLSIAVAVYNEEESLPHLCAKLHDVLSKLGKSYEIVLVDDGSTDKSWAVMNEQANRYPNLKLVKFRRNYGQTAAMSAGIAESDGAVLVTLDADLQNDPADIPALLAKLDEGYDVVSGWRKDRKDNPIKRNFPSRVANGLISVISGVRLHDYGCSLKAYRRDIIKGVKLYGEMHRFIPIHAAWQGARVTEVSVTHHPRIHGASKYGIERTLKVILDLMTVKFLDKYAQKPMYLFGGFGLASIALSMLFFVFMLYCKLFLNKSFIETPLPLAVVMFMLIGIVAVFMGLIAEILMRTYHESQDKPTYIVDCTRNCKD